MRGRLVSLLLGALLALPLPALAGSIYKCAGSDGVRQLCQQAASPAPSASSSAAIAPGRAPKPRIAAEARWPAAGAGGRLAARPADTAPRRRLPRPRSPRRCRAAAPRVVRGQVYSLRGHGRRAPLHQRAPRRRCLPPSVRTISYSYIETCYACGAMPGRQLPHPAAEHRGLPGRDPRRGHANTGWTRPSCAPSSTPNPRSIRSALSRVGAQGLMQLMPATARRFGVANAFDAAQNIRGGVQYLAWLLQALQRQPDPGRGRLQRRRGRGGQVRWRAALQRDPALRAAGGRAGRPLSRRAQSGGLASCAGGLSAR